MKLTTRAANRAAGQRSRATEPAEQRRADLRAAKRCIACGEPSETQRCPGCRAEVEANTPRYHGSGVKGPPSKARTDLTDLRYAAVELTSATALYEQVSPLATRNERAAALIEPLAKLALALGFIGDVLRRNGHEVASVREEDLDEDEDRTRRSQLYFEHKSIEKCVRCPRAASDESVLCPRCRRRESRRQRLLRRRRRAARRTHQRTHREAA